MHIAVSNSSYDETKSFCIVHIHYKSYFELRLALFLLLKCSVVQLRDFQSTTSLLDKCHCCARSWCTMKAIEILSINDKTFIRETVLAHFQHQQTTLWLILQKYLYNMPHSKSFYKYSNIDFKSMYFYYLYSTLNIPT